MRSFLAILLTIGAVLGAAWLLLQRGDVPYEQLERIYAGPDSQFMGAGDGEFVHYTDTGPRDAPVLVFVHGFSASLKTWESWRASLDDEYRVITIDLPGHGLTRANADADVSAVGMVDFVDRVTEDLGAERFTLIGSSMGGWISWNFALTHPERVEGLVLVGASGWPAAEDEKTPLAFQIIGNPLAQAVLKNMDLTMLVRSGLKDSFTDQSFVTEEMVERYAMFSRAPGHRDILLRLVSRDDRDGVATAEKMAEIAVPTLILHGEDDKLVPVAGGRRFAETIRDAEIVVYSGVGHLPQEEAAATSLADLEGFLQTRVYPEDDGAGEEPVGAGGDEPLSRP